MPTYEYICANGHAFERIQKMNDKPVAKCPECGAKAERKISGGQGLIFKGSGFYITDYGKDGKGPRKGGEGAASMPEPSSSKSEGKSEAKSADAAASPAKTESTPKPDKKPKSGSADSA
jgi:putative FmdB family regulatory protein